MMNFWNYHCEEKSYQFGTSNESVFESDSKFPCQTKIDFRLKEKKIEITSKSIH